MASAIIEMHAEHRQWRSDNSMWRDDLELWQKEIGEVLAGLRKLESPLQEQRKALQGHFDAIAATERVLQAHEHELAQFELGRAKDEIELLVMTKAHKKTADKHIEDRRAHEQMKKHHHTLMAHWSLLLKALTHNTGQHD